MKNNSLRNNSKKRLHTLVKIAILSALSTGIMLLEFPMTFIAPPFYKLDLSEAVILIGGFALGPVPALIIELIKNLLNLLINGTITGCVGELANFLTGASFTVVASLIYKYKKSIKGALIACVCGVLSLTILSAFINYFVVIPAYAAMFGGIDAIVSLGSAVNPAVNNLVTFVLICTVPFNAIKGVVCSVVTFLLYKRVSPILHI